MIVSRLQIAQLVAPRLVVNLRTRFFWQQRERFGQGFVQHISAQAAAHHQHFQTAFAAGKANRRLRQIGNFGAHRIAHQPVGIIESFGKRIKHAPRPARQIFVRHAGNGVLLVYHNRHTGKLGRHAARKGNKTAKTDHRVDTVFFNNGRGRLNGFSQGKRQHQLALQAIAAHAFNRQRFQLDIVLRHNARFHCTLAAQPHHMVSARAQHFGHRQRRKNMAAGAAGHQ